MKSKIVLFGRKVSVPEWLPIPKWAEQFLQFAVIGFMNTFLDLLILTSLSFLTGITKGGGAAGLKAISFGVVSFVSFLANKKWTFKEKAQKIGQEATKYSQFMIITLGGLGVNTGVVFTITNYFSPLYLPVVNFQLTDRMWLVFASLVATAFSLIWNFIGYKFIVFKK